jgi:hypothetical protein
VARNEPKEKQKLYGQANFTLSKLVNAPGSSLTKPLKDALEAPVGGNVIIGAKAIDTDQSVSTVSFRPIIDMTHFIKERVVKPREDKIFIVISAQEEEGGKYYPVLKTECQQEPKSKSIYKFNRMRTDSALLANNDPESFIVFTAFRFRD